MSLKFSRGPVSFLSRAIILVGLFAFVCGIGSCGTSHDEVVFVGASTIARWPNYVDFPSRNWIAKGIPGDTSAMVLQRFDADVLQSHAKSVQILCGINDMNSPTFNPDDLIANWKKMIHLAQGAGMKVYIGTLQPVGVGVHVDATRNADVDAVNARLKQMAPAEGAILIDYHEILSAPDGTFDAKYTDDGIHPNDLGYHRMTALAERVLWHY